MSLLEHVANPGLHMTVFKALTAGVFGMNMNVVMNDEAEIFTKSHLKADQLPAIEHCQSSIFRELRLRETVTDVEPVAVKQVKARRSMFGFKLRLSAIAPQPMLRLS